MWLDDIDECARYESAEHVVNGERQRGRVLRDVTVALFLEFASWNIYYIS